MYNLKNTKNIKDQPSNILIMGGSGILGRTIATEFGRHGWSVGIHYHQNRVSAEETAATIKETKNEAHAYQANVGNPSQIKNLLQTFVQDYGSLTLLVWAIGVAPSKLLAKTSSDEWSQSIETNLTGAFHVLKAAGAIFAKQRDGAVVLIGSLSGEQGIAGQAAYAASKAGLMGLMRTTAQEWGNWNIRVNAIFPGWHLSPLSASGIDAALAHQPHILHRTPSLNSVASSVYHLALSQDISGQIWNLDSRIC